MGKNVKFLCASLERFLDVMQAKNTNIQHEEDTAPQVV